MPWTSRPRAASGQGQPSRPDAELEDGSAAGSATSAASAVGAGLGIGDVAVPVVVDVGEAVAVGARLVALHRPSVAARDAAPSGRGQ